MATPLTGIRVLDFGQIIAGPLCAMQLGDLGADVIKVEAPSGELGRHIGPPLQEGESLVALSFNRNKRSVAIDLRQPSSRPVIRRLIAGSDVLIESFRPGVMGRLGLGFDDVAALRPDIVYCSVSAYGQTGPWRDRPGVDGIIQAASGLMSVTGLADSEPCKTQVPIADMVTGFMATSAVLAALRERDATGRGTHLDISLFASALSLQQLGLASFLSTGTIPRAIGSGAAYATPNEAYPTSDGWLMVAAYQPRRWTDFCEVIGRPDLLADPRFGTNASRLDHRGELRAEIAGALSGRSTLDWASALADRDVLCAPVADYADVVSSRPYVEGGFEISLPQARAGAVRQPGPTLGGLGREDHRPPPSLGEHTREILLESGFAEAEVADLLRERTVVMGTAE